MVELKDPNKLYAQLTPSMPARATVLAVVEGEKAARFEFDMSF